MIRQPRGRAPLPRWVAAAVAVAAVLVARPSPPSSSAAEGTTDGRLGGTFASLIERFGEQTGQIEGLGVLFAYPDARHLAVQFGTDDVFDPDDPALFMTVIADRDETASASEADPADWSLDEADAIAADLAPADAELAEPDASTPGTVTVTLRSEALEEAFGAVSLGEGRVTYLLSSEESVSTITLTLTAGAEADPGGGAGTPEPACAGVVGWAAASAERLEAARGLLEGLTTLPDDPAEQVELLRGLAGDLDALADEQRGADAPPEVATANYYIIGALADFAGAVATAAEGVEAGDQALVDEAVDALGAADRRAESATAEIEAAVAACDLEIATPDAA